MINFQLYEMAKVREQEFIAQAARRNRNAGAGILAGVARRLRRDSGSHQA